MQLLFTQIQEQYQHRTHVSNKDCSHKMSPLSLRCCWTPHRAWGWSHRDIRTGAQLQCIKQALFHYSGLRRTNLCHQSDWQSVVYKRNDLQAPVGGQAPAVPLIHIWDDPIRSLHHLHRVPAEQFAFVLDELPPEASVGPDDGPTGLHPGVCLCERHPVVFHEVSQAERGRAAHSCGTVHQHRAPLTTNAVDLISHTVKVQRDGRVRHVRQGYLDVLHVRPVEVGQLDGGVDHTGDAFGQEQAAVGGHVAAAEEQVRSDLCDAPQEAATLRQQPGHRGGHHGAAMVVVMVVVVEEALAARTHLDQVEWHQSKGNSSEDNPHKHCRISQDAPRSALEEDGGLSPATSIQRAFHRFTTPGHRSQECPV